MNGNEYVKTDFTDSIRNAWSSLQKMLEICFGLLLKQENAPESSFNPLKTTKSSLQKEINIILNKAIDVLEVSELSSAKDSIQRLDKDRREILGEINDLELKKLSVGNRSITTFWKDSKESILKRVGRLKGAVALKEQEINSCKIKMLEILKLKNVNINEQQIDCLLFSITCDNEVQIISVYNNIKTITSVLKNIMTSADSNIENAKRYYGMTAVL